MTAAILIITLAAFAAAGVGFLAVVVAIRQEDRHRIPLGARPAHSRLTRGVRRLLGLYVHVHIDEDCDSRCPLFAHNRQAKISAWTRGGDQP